MTLQDYITKAYRVLRDSGSLYQTPEIIAWTNEARRRRDLDTRLVRSVRSFAFVTNQSTYAMGTIGAGTVVRGETLASMPAANCRDIVSVYYIPGGGAAGGTGIRVPLGRHPYSRVAAIVSTSWPGFPAGYAVLGTSTVVVAPPPAMAYPAEWDLVGYYPELVNVTDVEPMVDPYNDPVPYLTAAIAKANMQRFDEAQVLEGQYIRNLGALGFDIRRFSIPNPAWDLGRRR